MRARILFPIAALHAQKMHLIVYAQRIVHQHLLLADGIGKAGFVFHIQTIMAVGVIFDFEAQLFVGSFNG